MTSDVRPNFSIIGAARSSTTAVAWALGARPDVFVTNPKETHFWAFGGRSAPHFSGPGDDTMINSRVVVDPEAYLALYENARGVPLRGDGSVSTLYHPASSIETLRRHADPDVRLVCIVREPAARARSAHLYLRARGHEPLACFADALDAEAERIEAGWHHLWHYRAMSRYSDQLPPFVDAFGDRLLVVVAEEIVADPVGFSESLCRHLDLDPALGLDLSREVNVGGEPRSAAVTSTLNRLRAVDPVRRAVRAATPTRLREVVRRWSVTRHPIDPTDGATLNRLRTECRNDVETVEAVLGRRVQIWP